jgi:hypothetical protein
MDMPTKLKWKLITTDFPFDIVCKRPIVSLGKRLITRIDDVNDEEDYK